jgi:endonuclease-3
MPPDRSAPAVERIKPILTKLRRRYPGATIALDFSTPMECVVATILSAQSTDALVNTVTPMLFAKYRRPEDYLAVPEEELQTDIQSTGFFRQKTKALRGMARTLIEEFDGEVPRRVDELIKLPGVARKSANVIQSACFPEMVGKDESSGIAVDTHVGRVAVRLALTGFDSKDAVRIERDLIEVVPKRDHKHVAFLFITHGRTICDAKRPLCADCPIEPLCPSSQEAGLPDLYRVTAKKKTALKKATATKKATRKKKATTGKARRG